MRNMSDHSGFSMAELLIVVVISALAMAAVYQTLISQDRTYRYQAGSIEAQNATRTSLQVLASELREISASAGETPASTGGSDLLIATSDSIRFRAFRKVGIVCAVDPGSPPGYVDVWVPGEQFVTGDSIFLFLEGDPNTEDDDTWQATDIKTVQAEASNLLCETEWSYDTQSLRGLPSGPLVDAVKGAFVRSFETVTYRKAQYDGSWVLARRVGSGPLVPLIGPIDSAGLRFRYYDAAETEITNLAAESERARVARVNVEVIARSPGAGMRNQPLIDSLSTNIYLRGN